MQVGGRKNAGQPRPGRIPSVTAVGWHVMLSIAFMAPAMAAMGWLFLNALDALRSEQLTVAVVRVLVAGVLLASLVVGGKGIQAAGRIGGATGSAKQSMLRLTRRLFSWQVLLMIGAAIVGLAVEAVVAFGKCT